MSRNKDQYSSDISYPVLTPSGTLRFFDDSTPWQQKLFELGAKKLICYEPVKEFWQNFAQECINYLCHASIPEASALEDAKKVESIAFPKDIHAFVENAPPMPGGEYMDERILQVIWQKLLEWVAQQIRLIGGITTFLKYQAPEWSEVGRIFFHLGENKLDTNRPFAFLATYATGLNEKGQLRHAPLGEAFKRYRAFPEILTRLLEPIHHAAEAFPWISKMCNTGDIYRATSWQPAQAYQFLLSSEQLEKQGIGIRLPDWWKKRRRLRVRSEINTRSSGALGLQALLDCDINIAIGDEIIEEKELWDWLEGQQDGLVLIKNQWVEVDKEKLHQAIDFWREIKRTADMGGIDFIRGMRMLSGCENLSKSEEKHRENGREWFEVTAGSEFRNLLKGMRAENLSPLDTIPGLQAQLRPYQANGVAWLRFLTGLGLGACLADDMGLGKTIQIISWLLLTKNKREMPALLTVPASLISNWKAECARFAPDLKWAIIHPSELPANEIENFASPGKLKEYDLLITSYAMCARLTWLNNIQWGAIIADEAQNIKNSQTRQSRAIRGLKGDARIAITGTPIENNINELWTLFDFINPGLLGNRSEFNTLLENMESASTGFAPLKKLTSPYILRRMKTDKMVIDSLPEKTEMKLYCQLSNDQARLYKKVVEKIDKNLESLDASKASKIKRNLIILQNLMLLKQICNHPAQAGLDGIADYAPERSGKFLRLGELCSEINSRQECAIIFTQFKEIIDPLENYLAQIFGTHGLKLHGGTSVKKRGELVKQFQMEDGPPFFILSLKAGGSGLNLTRATHVIHFDRWWNPAVEDQATDRAFRIGQKKNVLVHKCLTSGTLEEKIDVLIEKKRELAGQILGSMENNITDMSDEQILEMVRLDARCVME